MIRKSRIRVYPGLINDIVRTVLAENVGKGEYLKSFPAVFAEFINVKYAMFVPSDTVGIRFLLSGMGLNASDEIIMPAYASGFVSRLSRQNSIIAKHVDVDADSFNIDPDRIEAAITSHSKAVVASHMFGLPCDIEKVLHIAHKNGLKVIEDCTHSVGASSGNRQTGSFGDVAYFSLSTDGLLNTLGGGVIVTSDGEMARAMQAMITDDIRRSPKFPSSLRFLRKAICVLVERLFIERVMSGLNVPVPDRIERECARFTNLQALIGMKQLSMLNKLNARRRAAAQWYDSRLNDYAAFQRSGRGVQRVYHRYVANYPVMEQDPGKIKVFGRSKGVEVGIRSDIATVAGISGDAAAKFPVSSSLYDSNIQLPLFDDMKLSDREAVMKIFRK
ncbi:MAG: aminotransferase class I/II-fold pyridoxal phosphate-dependent enzyme [Candidatus Omnitrophota bacterium]